MAREQTLTAWFKSSYPHLKAGCGLSSSWWYLPGNDAKEKVTTCWHRPIRRKILRQSADGNRTSAFRPMRFFGPVALRHVRRCRGQFCEWRQNLATPGGLGA